MDLRIKPGEEYRAFIEDVGLHNVLIAKGNYDYVQKQLANWLDAHPLEPAQNALIMHVVRTTHGPELPMLVFGHEVGEESNSVDR